MNQKPLTVSKKEFQEAMEGIINEYLQYLPAFVVRQCLFSADVQLEKLDAQQLQQDQEAWKASQADQKEGDEGDG